VLLANSSGSLAMLAAMRRASSRVSILGLASWAVSADYFRGLLRERASCC
jgi:hypothetical protein